MLHNYVKSTTRTSMKLPLQPTYTVFLHKTCPQSSQADTRLEFRHANATIHSAGQDCFFNLIEAHCLNSVCSHIQTINIAINIALRKDTQTHTLNFPST